MRVHVLCAQPGTVCKEQTSLVTWFSQQAVFCRDAFEVGSRQGGGDGVEVRGQGFLCQPAKASEVLPPGPVLTSAHSVSQG